MEKSFYLRPVQENDSFSELRRYIMEVAMSLSGRLDAGNYNTFLNESIELLSNAIDIFHEGYFDAAYYLVRSSIEVSTVGVYFSDSQDEKRGAIRKAWINLSYFPVQRKLLKRLKAEGSAFSEFREKVPAFFDLLDKGSDYANKVIHKQGYQWFYSIRNHPLYREKYSLEALTDGFADYLQIAIGIIAVMRLAIDPFPVLLTDEECRNRFADSVTRPYSDELVEKCIGQEILTQYKSTDFYNSVKQWIIAEFPTMSDAAYNAQQIGYIEVARGSDLLCDINLVSFRTACAILFTLALKEVCEVYVFGGLDWYFNDRYESIPASSKTTLFDQVKKSGRDNYLYVAPRTNTSEGNIANDNTYLTARTVGDDDFVIGTVRPLSDDQIVFLDAVVEELSSLHPKAAREEHRKIDIKSTAVYNRILALQTTTRQPTV